MSSGYIQAHDLSTVPEPRSIIPPFEDVLKFKSQYEEDGLYIDLVRLKNLHRESSHPLFYEFFNKLGKIDKMRGLPSILSLFRNKFNKFNNTGALMLDSIYYITLKLF